MCDLSDKGKFSILSEQSKFSRYLGGALQLSLLKNWAIRFARSSSLLGI